MMAVKFNVSWSFRVSITLYKKSWSVNLQKMPMMSAPTMMEIPYGNFFLTSNNMTIKATGTPTIANITVSNDTCF
jgi:hypothetical protein